MNYYPHHIGDYLKNTAHLTMLEDGAYRRLIDLYYLHESALPAEPKKVYRLARATQASERAAIDTILDEYFTLTEAGWTHKRCDEEIERGREKSDESDAKKENEKERQRRHRQRRAELFEALREYGVVPPWDTTTSDLQDALSRQQSRDQSQSPDTPVTPPVTRTATANQKPITNNQIKDNPHSPPDGELPLGDEAPPETPEPKAKRERGTTLAVWLDRCVKAGEKPISDYEPLARYVQESNLPIEFVNLAWQQFKRDFLPGGKYERKLQIQWRRHFQNFVEKNYFKLWYAKPAGDGVTYELTTVGLQAQMTLRQREAA